MAMTRFYLNEKERLNKALQLMIAALQKYNSKDFETDTALKLALDEALLVYKDLGKSNQQSQFEALMAEWVTAQRGINPITLEKVTVRRHEMLGTVKFKVMQRAQQQLAMDVEAVEAVLNEATTLVSQIIVAALQAGLITPADIQRADNADAVEMIWKNLDTDNNILLGQQRVLLMISRYDALLIFGDLLQQLR
jgi:hypothetical protein